MSDSYDSVDALKSTDLVFIARGLKLIGNYYKTLDLTSARKSILGKLFRIEISTSNLLKFKTPRSKQVLSSLCVVTKH